MKKAPLESIRPAVTPLSSLPTIDDLADDDSQCPTTMSPVQAVESIDITLLINEEDKFLSAAMLLCNELKGRFHANQVALGWLRGNHIIIRAISNTQKFDKRDIQLKTLVYAMEECADQNEEITFPIPKGEGFIAREHNKYAALTQHDCITSLPLRIEREDIGVITLERSNTTFTPLELQTLRLIADLNSKRLAELERRSQWFGKRWARKLGQAIRWVFGFENTWTKVGALATIALLAFLIFYPWNYRVEAPFQLKVENITHLPAPFNGFIEAVHAELGDNVQANQLLLSLDKRELLLQESEILAKINRFESEAKSHKASGQLRDSNLARIAMQEETTRLEMTRHRLQQADLRAPFDGIVVEGELKERIGSPLQTGDPLFRLARLDDVYLRLEIAEDDIHEIAAQATGEFAFTSKPETKYNFTIAHIYPAAEPKGEGSVFYARCTIEDIPADWWRPGMNGVSKINVGERSVLWVLTHRLVDFIRMKLWI